MSSPVAGVLIALIIPALSPEIKEANKPATAITKIKFYIISYKNLLVFSGAQSLIWLYQYFLSSSKDSFLVMS